MSDSVKSSTPIVSAAPAARGLHRVSTETRAGAQVRCQGRFAARVLSQKGLAHWTPQEMQEVAQEDVPAGERRRVSLALKALRTDLNTHAQLLIDQLQPSIGISVSAKEIEAALLARRDCLLAKIAAGDVHALNPPPHMVEVEAELLVWLGHLTKADVERADAEGGGLRVALLLGQLRGGAEITSEMAYELRRHVRAQRVTPPEIASAALDGGHVAIARGPLALLGLEGVSAHPWAWESLQYHALGTVLVLQEMGFVTGEEIVAAQRAARAKLVGIAIQALGTEACAYDALGWVYRVLDLSAAYTSEAVAREITAAALHHAVSDDPMTAAWAFEVLEHAWRANPADARVIDAALRVISHATEPASIEWGYKVLVHSLKRGFVTEARIEAARDAAERRSHEPTE